MSLNSAHVPNGGVLIHAGECIILFCKNVTVDFDNVGDCAPMRGDKKGKLYLTTHRMIFHNEKAKEELKSFSFPFCTLNEVELEQPLFGANFIKGKVRAQPGGGFEGDVKFKLIFKDGGCIEFGQAMVTAAKLANRHSAAGYTPPAYTPYGGDFYPAPPPAYSPPTQGYGGWVPPYTTFPNQPPADSVYVHDAPPPYPGVTGFISPSAPPAGVMQPPPPGFYNPDNPQMGYTQQQAQQYHASGPPPPYSKKDD